MPLLHFKLSIVKHGIVLPVAGGLVLLALGCGASNTEKGSYESSRAQTADGQAASSPKSKPRAQGKKNKALGNKAAADKGTDEDGEENSQTSKDYQRTDASEYGEVGVLFRHAPGSSDQVESDCTGTLIRTDRSLTYNIVITAKHCQGMDTFYLGDGRAVIYPDDNDWQAAVVGMPAYRVIDTEELSEGEVTEQMPCPFTFADQRLLLLERDVSEAEPAPIAKAAPSVGEQCYFVGFGRHLDDDGVVRHLIKRGFPVPIAEVTARDIFQRDVSQGTAGPGDSGGPLFCGAAVAATDSCGFGENPNAQINQWMTRTDVQIQAIDRSIARLLGRAGLTQLD